MSIPEIQYPETTNPIREPMPPKDQPLKGAGAPPQEEVADKDSTCEGHNSDCGIQSAMVHSMQT